MADENLNNASFLITLDPGFQPPPTPPMRISPTATHINNPFTTMVKLIDNQWGPCPISSKFPMHGGTLVINFSATAHSDATIPPGSIAIVGYDIYIDNNQVGRAQTMVTNGVWNYCSTDIVVNNLSIDDHVVMIQAYGPYTSNDQFNLFNLTVLEF
jgi:hypothetical protein